MAGDNGKIFEQHQGKQLMTPMEEQGYRDLNKMESVGSTDEVAILVQFDTLSDRENTYRIYIRPTTEGRQIENIPEQNTGDPSSLRDFIVWGIENYPAENYAVILWNHGTGWKEDDIYAFAKNRQIKLQAKPDEVRSVGNRRLGSALFLSSVLEIMQLEDEKTRAIAFDDSSLDFLDNAKLQQAFQEAEEQTGQKVSLIGMDACLMSTVEVAYQLRSNADYMVSSQEVEPMEGWPYKPILQHLTSHPEMTTEVLAKLIVQEYGRYYEEEFWQTRGSSRKVTQSATNLKAVERLAEAIGHFASALTQLLTDKDNSAEWSIYRAQKKVLRFKDKDSVDLYDILQRIKDNYDGDNPKLKADLDTVINLINVDPELKSVIEKTSLGFETSPQGMSIYLPIQEYSPLYDRSDFARCGWGDFIRTYNNL